MFVLLLCVVLICVTAFYLTNKVIDNQNYHAWRRTVKFSDQTYIWCSEKDIERICRIMWKNRN